MKAAARYSLSNDSKHRGGRAQKSGQVQNSTIRRRAAKMANQDRVVVGSKDQLEENYGAELEGPFGLIWFSRNGRMMVWSYKSRGRATIAAYNMVRKAAFEKPELELL